MALLLLFSFPGAPCLYYGDELGLSGNHDPECRQGMPWEHPDSWNLELQGFTKALISLRREHAALRRGAFRTLHADGGLYLFAKEHEGEVIVGALNLGPQDLETMLPQRVAEQLARDQQGAGGSAARDLDALLPTGRLHVRRENGNHSYELTLPARSGSLFRLS